MTPGGHVCNYEFQLWYLNICINEICMGLIVYSIRHYIIKYIDMIIINYDYRIYCFDRGKMVVYREHICPT